ncbi:MAG: glycosyltransferase family 2 protein [Phycisphaerales bacterium]|nr:glycosyltransferase family 2 protein [Phycisphaerales bacterium]
MTCKPLSCTDSQRTLLQRTLVAIPIYNEQRHVADVLGRVRQFAPNVLAIDDGSTDHTPTLLAMHPVEVIRHAENRGYGRSMLDAFRWAAVDRQEWVITMDCDEQHEPESIPDFLRAMEDGDADVISGSRYLAPSNGDSTPPSDRRAINSEITAELNERLGLQLTDGFCGFKAYRVSAVRRLNLDVDGYDFPMQFWVQAVAHGLRIRELPIRLIYNDPNRSFGGPLDDPAARLAQYRRTMHSELIRCRRMLRESAWRDLAAAEAACCTCGH